MNRVALLMELKGWVNAAALQGAVSDLVARHEALRTVYSGGYGQFNQHISPAADFRLERRDLKGLPSDRQMTALWEILNAEVNLPPRLDGAMLSLTLFDLGNKTWMLGGFVYHIAFDGGSANTFWGDLLGAYQNRVLGYTGRASPPLQYADYVLWENEWLTPRQLDAANDFWRARLASVTPLLLPTARNSGATPSPIGNLSFDVGGEEFIRILNRAREMCVTLSILFLAAVVCVVGRLAGSPRPLIGTISNSRPVGFERTVGCFMQLRAVSVDLSGNPSFAEVVTRTRKCVTETSDIRLPPPMDLLLALEADRVLVNYTVAPRRSVASAKAGGRPVGLTSVNFRDLPLSVKDQFSRDLQFSVTQLPEELRVLISFAADRADTGWALNVAEAVRARLLSTDCRCPTKESMRS